MGAQCISTKQLFSKETNNIFFTKKGFYISDIERMPFIEYMLIEYVQLYKTSVIIDMPDDCQISLRLGKASKDVYTLLKELLEAQDKARLAYDIK